MKRKIRWFEFTAYLYLARFIYNAEQNMGERRTNWQIWVGFALTLVGILSYFLFFDRFPITRDTPWVSGLLFLAAMAFLLQGSRLAFREPQTYRGKAAGPALSAVSLLLIAAFAFFTFDFTRRLPASISAPHVGQRAPDFTLVDTSGKTVTLAELLSAPVLPAAATPPKGVLLVFYRGYW